MASEFKVNQDKTGLGDRDSLKKNVVFSKEGLVWTTTQVCDVGSHCATTMNIVLYRRAQCARQGIPSTMTIDRLRSQSAIVRNIREVEAQRMDMFPVHFGTIKHIVWQIEWASLPN